MEATVEGGVEIFENWRPDTQGNSKLVENVRKYENKQVPKRLQTSPEGEGTYQFNRKKQAKPFIKTELEAINEWKIKNQKGTDEVQRQIQSILDKQSAVNNSIQNTTGRNPIASPLSSRALTPMDSKEDATLQEPGKADLKKVKIKLQK